MLCDYDKDLAKQATSTSSRVRGLLNQAPGAGGRHRHTPGSPRDGCLADEVPHSEGRASRWRASGRDPDT